MFKISKAEEQGLRLIMRLASAGQQQTLSELAEAEELPEPTVAKLLGFLRRGGVVDAVRGRNGGYVLADSPQEISAGKVLFCLSGDPAFVFPCLEKNDEDCPRNTDCGLRPVWHYLETRVADILNKTSVADLLRSEAQATVHLKEIWPEQGR